MAKLEGDRILAVFGGYLRVKTNTTRSWATPRQTLIEAEVAWPLHVRCPGPTRVCRSRRQALTLCDRYLSRRNIHCSYPLPLRVTRIGDVMRSGLLWMIGIPIPIILAIAFFSGHL
jgi:hypothetical protein